MSVEKVVRVQENVCISFARQRSSTAGVWGRIIDPPLPVFVRFVPCVMPVLAVVRLPLSVVGHVSSNHSQ